MWSSLDDTYVVNFVALTIFIVVVSEHPGDMPGLPLSMFRVMGNYPVPQQQQDIE